MITANSRLKGFTGITMSDNQERIEALLRDGIGAAKAGNTTEAQTLLREVVALDENNEKGWIWLAAVVDTEDEKRVCLSNVLVINPNNKKAKDELNTIERQAGLQNIRLHEQAAINSRAVLILGTVVVVAVLVSLALLIGLSGLQSNVTVPTAANLDSANTLPAGTDAVAAAATEAATVAPAIVPTTAVASETPATLPPTATKSTPGVEVALLQQKTLPPTWTPLPSPTSEIPPTGTPLAKPPAALPGRLVVISGPVITLEGFLPVWVLKPDGSDFKRVTDDALRGDYGILTPDGKLIYTFLAGGTDARLLRYVNLNGSQERFLKDAWGGLPPLDNQRMPTITRDGRIVAFAAQNLIQNEKFSAIYVVNLTRFLNFPMTPTNPPRPTTPPTEVPPPTTAPQPTAGKGTVRAPQPTAAVAPTKAPVNEGTPLPTITPLPMSANLVRVTPKDIGENDWPAISIDGKLIAFTTDATAVGKDGVDLYIAPVKPDTAPFQLTNDGNALIESAPAISPDGKKVVFAAASEARIDKQKNDLILINADGSGRETLVHLDGVNNIRPHWSPDGKFIAFSSDRTGKMEVFILDLATKQVYQVTETPNPTILTDWSFQ
jgi:hypothetical protein